MKTCCLILAALLLPSSHAVCPDKEPVLQPWMPGHSEDHRVTIGYGRKVLLTSSATVHSIEILSGGELHIGSRDCPYKGNLTISLFGRLDDSDKDHSYFGRKYIGVGTGGTLEIHGEKKLSWTFLNKTLHPGESNQNNYLFQRGWGSRGIIIHVIDPKSGEVLHNDRFDTYRSKDESRRLAKYVDGVGAGLILALMVNDEGSNNLEDSAKKILFRLGSQHINTLGFRHPWTFIVTKGDPSSVVEGHASYQEAEWTEWFDRDDERGSGDWEKVSDLHEAYPDKLCSNPLDIQAETHDGIAANQTGDVIHKNDKDYGFVCLNKDQTHGLCRNYRVRFLCGKLVRPQASVSIDMLSNSSILELGDEAQGWRSGDRVVVASTDYSMHQAEEFSLMPCSTCTSSQVKVQGKRTSNV
ncbi:Cell migration-inducing and hyaluronan-binding protein [Dissostichus eleginoides]|uniref:Cell migration-inducing and hyaluronan-binding protein n=1 Tax=Dissostichus eleginoides TaxID=100907 RepID=A0AAD9C0C0_DISEL|nr:Cell migration-inducing and hyaluronan-binding protein [Dissostichus eleginoides]